MDKVLTKEELNEKYHLGFEYPLTDEQVEEIEKEHQCYVKPDANITVNNPDNLLPFGVHYFTWREMKEQHMDRDGVIWYYDNIGCLSGRSGYVLIKGEFITGWNVTVRMS